MAGKQAFLPMSQTDAQGGTTSGGGGGMRRRLSSISDLHLKIQSSSMSAATWGLRRSKSAASMGEHAASSIRKWWEWGWAWIQFRKPVGSDLEMSEEDHRLYNHNNNRETNPISSSLRNVFLKVRKEFRRFAGGNDRVGLPQTYKYDSFNYAKNFDG
ncbi:uncharacterized protein LOC124932139 [Impatiens glandulifera]|uniref:uncharacterized protein LOC124932139 n=1 Tax=Impatiens glandulifera TaxID=253017 RepID=UPI001FB13732|nr:uncharacterized protein LOC124932139 [Impatiens glandulifera]